MSEENDNETSRNTEANVSVLDFTTCSTFSTPVKLLSPQDLLQQSINNSVSESVGIQKSARTPSGNVILNQFEQTRRLFSPIRQERRLSCPSLFKHDNHVVTESSETCSQVQTVTPHRSTKQTIQAKSTTKQVKGTSELRPKRKLAQHNPVNAEAAAFDLYKYLKTEKQEKIIKMKEQKSAEKQSETALKKGDERTMSASSDENQTPAKKYKKLDQHQPAEDEISAQLNHLKTIIAETPDKEMPVVNVKTVVEMFEKMNAKISQMQNPRQQRLDMECKDAVSKRIDTELQDTFQHYDQQISSLQKEVQAVQEKNELMNDVMIHSNNLIEDLASRLDGIEMSNARRSAILTGFYTSDRKHIMIQQVSQLFSDVLHTSLHIEDAYHLGAKQPKPIVITFNSAEDKVRLFQKKSLLNKVRNKDGGKYYLNDYLPAKVSEKKRREKDIVKAVKSDPKQDDSNKVEYTKQGLKIGPSLYKKKVVPPDHTDLLKFSSQEIDAIMKIPIKKGTQVIKDGHIFTPYAIDAHDTQKVSNAYLKIRLINARAKHVVCAFCLPGEPSFLYNDSCDDDDHGAGRVISKAMMNSGVTNKAIFVVRQCAKQKLGAERFECYLKAAHNIMVENPLNQITKKKQSLNIEKRQELKPQEVRDEETTVYQAKKDSHFKKKDKKTRDTDDLD